MMMRKGCNISQRRRAVLLLFVIFMLSFCVGTSSSSSSSYSARPSDLLYDYSSGEYNDSAVGSSSSSQDRPQLNVKEEKQKDRTKKKEKSYEESKRSTKLNLAEPPTQQQQQQQQQQNDKPVCALDRNGIYGTLGKYTREDLVEFSYEVEVDLSNLGSKQQQNRLDGVIRLLERDMGNGLIQVLFRQQCHSLQSSYYYNGRLRRLRRDEGSLEIITGISFYPEDNIRNRAFCQDLIVTNGNYCVVIDGKMTVYADGTNKYDKNIILDAIREVIELKELSTPDAIANIAFLESERTRITFGSVPKSAYNNGSVSNLFSVRSMVICASIVVLALSAIMGISMYKCQKEREDNRTRFASVLEHEKKITASKKIDVQEEEKGSSVTSPTRSSSRNSESLRSAVSWSSEEGTSDMPCQTIKISPSDAQSSCSSDLVGDQEQGVARSLRDLSTASSISSLSSSLRKNTTSEIYEQLSSTSVSTPGGGGGSGGKATRRLSTGEICDRIEETVKKDLSIGLGWGPDQHFDSFGMFPDESDADGVGVGDGGVVVDANNRQRSDAITPKKGKSHESNEPGGLDSKRKTIRRLSTGSIPEKKIEQTVPKNTNVGLAWGETPPNQQHFDSFGMLPNEINTSAAGDTGGNHRERNDVMMMMEHYDKGKSYLSDISWES